MSCIEKKLDTNPNPKFPMGHRNGATGIGGSVVEFSPATREARVRFPANAVNIFGNTTMPIRFDSSNLDFFHVFMSQNFFWPAV